MRNPLINFDHQDWSKENNLEGDQWDGTERRKVQEGRL